MVSSYMSNGLGLACFETLTYTNTLKRICLQWKHTTQSYLPIDYYVLRNGFLFRLARLFLHNLLEEIFSTHVVKYMVSLHPSQVSLGSCHFLKSELLHAVWIMQISE